MSHSDLALSVRGLSKSYTIAHNAAKHTTLTEALVSALLRPGRSVEKETFWALRDVEFDVKKGDVVGIIGRNGAGKSTLLKILSRITVPTSGQIDLYGRVGSLLEVGTGFHPELTGRENIYMNGAILGMTKREITQNFDAIVDFSGTEKFLDTPVKRYSSGMYVRLAFAVAAHLSSEILIVDEVLAVGDAEFQKKCLSKMQDVAEQEGRTVLFVSHNIAAVKSLCNQCVLLRKGTVEMAGSPTQVVGAYLADGADSRSERRWSGPDTPGDDTSRLLSVRLCQPAEVPCDTIDVSQPFEIEIETDAQIPDPHTRLTVTVLADDGQILMHAPKRIVDAAPSRRPGRCISVCRFPAHTLNTGGYFLSIVSDIPNEKLIFKEDGVLSWNVAPAPTDMTNFDTPNWPGIISPGIVSWSESHSMALSA